MFQVSRIFRSLWTLLLGLASCALLAAEVPHDPGPLAEGVSEVPGQQQQLDQPDFVVTSVTLSPNPPAPGGVFSAKVTVKNQGTASGDGGLLDVWTHAPTKQGCGAHGHNRKPVGILAAGASKTLTFYNLPAGEASDKVFRAFVVAPASPPSPRRAITSAPGPIRCALHRILW